MTGNYAQNCAIFTNFQIEFKSSFIQVCSDTLGLDPDSFITVEYSLCISSLSPIKGSSAEMHLEKRKKNKCYSESIALEHCQFRQTMHWARINVYLIEVGVDLECFVKVLHTCGVLQMYTAQSSLMVSLSVVWVHAHSTVKSIQSMEKRVFTLLN